LTSYRRDVLQPNVMIRIYPRKNIYKQFADDVRIGCIGGGNATSGEEYVCQRLKKISTWQVEGDHTSHETHAENANNTVNGEKMADYIEHLPPP